MNRLEVVLVGGATCSCNVQEKATEILLRHVRHLSRPWQPVASGQSVGRLASQVLEILTSNKVWLHLLKIMCSLNSCECYMSVAFV